MAYANDYTQGLRELQNNKALKPAARGFGVLLCLRELQNNKALKHKGQQQATNKCLRELQNNKALKPQTSNVRIRVRIGIRLFCLCYDFTTKICGSKCFFVFLQC